MWRESVVCLIIGGVQIGGCQNFQSATIMMLPKKFA